MKKTVLLLLALFFTFPALAGTMVNNLMVVNVTPVKAELFFTTDEPCLAKVIYHGSDNIKYLAQEENAGKMHHVAIKSLEADSEYLYEIKLMTPEDKVLAKIKKDEFSFKTAAFGVAMPCNVYGKFIGPDDLFIAVKVRSGFDGSESLALLTKPAKGVWTVNLGDLKSSEGKVIAPKKGDVIMVSAYNAKGAVKTIEGLFAGETIQKLDDLVF
jgi:hypothetical protein